VDGSAAAALASPYGRAAASRTFADTRTVGPWDVWGELDGAPGEGLLRYASDDAFVALRLRYVDGEPHMEVIDLGWADAAGRGAVWGTLAGFRGHVARARVHVPWDDPVALDRVRGHAVTGHAGLMARVADVVLALSPLRSVADDDAPLELPPLHLRVIDPFAPWNDGGWRLEPGPTGTSVTPSRSAPDATLDVRGLALLVSGAGAPLDARRAGWADGCGRALATVAALSAGRRPYRSLVDAF
jgi:predicted acetyltransferase